MFEMKMRHFARAVVLGAVLATAGVSEAAPLSLDRAKEIAQDSKCFKCHGIDKKKDGPAWNAVAARYRDAKWTSKHKPGEDKAAIIHHITSGEKVKFEEDGHEEDHKTVKTSGDAETAAFAEWLLSL